MQPVLVINLLRCYALLAPAAASAKPNVPTWDLTACSIHLCFQIFTLFNSLESLRACLASHQIARGRNPRRVGRSFRSPIYRINSNRAT